MFIPAILPLRDMRKSINFNKNNEQPRCQLIINFIKHFQRPWK